MPVGRRLILPWLEDGESLVGLAIMAFHDTVQEVVSVTLIDHLGVRSLIQASVEIGSIEVDSHVAGGAPSRLWRSND